MAVLLIRLAGPMQAWGTQSRFTVRDTGLEPSKSAVIGLLCAALGKPRDESCGPPDLPTLADLAGLTVAVRVDRPGTMAADYHTAGGTHKVGDNYGVPTADGTSRRAVTSRRYYLADADFLVGLEGSTELLKKLDAALADPVWPLYLGRKSFVPSVPVRVPDGLKLEDTLPDALKHEAWWERTPWDKPAGPLRIVMDAGPGAEGEVRCDVPLNFVSRDRAFTIRRVHDIEFWEVPEELIQESPLCIFPRSR